MATLEEQFDTAMRDVYRNAKQHCNYNATYFLQMVTEFGGLEAARRLLAKDLSSGFTELYLCGCLHLTAEAQMIRPEFAPLFTEAELKIARTRLAQLGYSPRS
ncbi:MAG: hypothetical protein IT329_04005 [Caldilineaceae bacterium]|nr:hypothetical protein [Caldilineaceae bacterium]